MSPSPRDKGRKNNCFCHYQGGTRVYALVGYSLAEAMIKLRGSK